jgi:hypothetical protein
MKRVAALAVLGLFLVAVPAAGADPQTPPNCTFSKGVTTCSSTTTTTSVRVTVVGGCTLTTEVTTTVVSYSAHRGAPGSNGREIAAPPPETTVTEGPTTTPCGGDPLPS